MNTRKKLAGGVAAALAVLGIGAAIISNETAPPPPAAVDEVDTPNAGVFYIICTFDHQAPDDPIVHPDMPGMSHSHDFFGGKGINAGTSPSDIRGGPTTCDEKGDTSGYWIPSTYVNDVNVKPIRVKARYSAGGKGVGVQPFPPDLVMVAGTTLVEPIVASPEIDWACLPGNPYLLNPEFQPCAPKALTTARVDFPDCWNGLDLDSANHRSHMAYSKLVPGEGIVCPATHPVSLVRLHLRIEYGKTFPASTTTPGVVTLASGQSNTLHADFMNAWQVDRLEQLVDRCINHRVPRCKS